MSSKLQLTTLAILVSAALPAQAALYKVVEVTEAEAGVSGAEYYGTAIQPSVAGVNCFDSGASSATCEGYKLAGETRNRASGFSYREEVPFAMDNSFGYIEDNYDGFEDYCFYQLGYSTCEYWASTQWSGWNNEAYGNNTANSLAFVTDGGTITASGINTVINSLDLSGNAIGNYSTSTVRNTPISGDVIIGWKQGRQWASDGTYTVGSVSSKTGIGSERYYYYSKPAVWNGTALTVIKWAHDDAQDGDYYAQGSMRDFYVDGTTSDFYGVGYNNYKDQHMNATIFKGTTALTDISSVQINNAQVDAGDDNTNSNSVATNINSNLVVVGQAKRSGNYPQNGAAANRLFVVPDASAASPNAIFFSSDIFFNGAGGDMGGINNYNEIVGRVDVENNREYEGKQRRQRAFIYPYGVTAKVPDQVTKNAINDRRAIFQNQAWIIDNLTNGGSVSSHNNQYRIYDASDINDAGVISATALKCAGGYDSVASDSYCGNGSTNETVVAVKLVPISDPAERSIESRPFENSTIERQGGSLGFGAMTLLGLFGFMRKRIK
ncbi:DUF3466 family protein [Aliivibrio sp. S4TY2]|uniref:DUF3466 family protein n=1 Tax=unclassified Aliivibrio TaxID=2645654 RepID=UPI0023789D32|nr:MULTISPECIES: DUF3466 family protein [unclassified Aliivibrio]MDD9157569.1 DUF3466 family protein [Aliivibrio sp. S4TY2]MDD9161468.1 DUF3466 family protein [Aliivibrio sp. S4TY1]MDD9165479.1 DUF3466 family protein [Aliivibrio sp. S4MY2]MDD9169497.1 DUF3466 family protein [Aliivibrio sp. S4MY4]MDD9186490.1 DUF3466 family protein [Aliivibrio sp. S4MY3]